MSLAYEDYDSIKISHKKGDMVGEGGYDSGDVRL